MRIPVWSREKEGKVEMSDKYHGQSKQVAIDRISLHRGQIQAPVKVSRAGTAATDHVQFAPGPLGIKGFEQSTATQAIHGLPTSNVNPITGE